MLNPKPATNELVSTQIIELAGHVERLHDAKGKAAAQEFIKGAMSFDSLVAAIHAPAASTRRKGLALAYYWGGGNAVDELMNVLRCDPSAIVRHEAAYYLGSLKRPEAIAALVRALHEDVAELVRHEAAEALGDMGAISAIGALKQALRDKSEEVAETAEASIEQLGASDVFR